MSQHAPSSSTGFFSKIRENYNAKFANLSLAAYTEKDGNSEEDTLIHNAFVKYFDSQHQPYPEWLGVTVLPARSANRNSNSYSNNSSYSGQNSHNINRNSHNNFSSNGHNELQPVYNNGNISNNSSYSQQSHQKNSYHLPQHLYDGTNNSVHSGSPEPQGGRPRPYQPRSSSKLQDMYNKSRQQSIPGSGYNTLPVQPGRSNSYSSNSTSGSRLRERMFNTSPSQSDSVDTNNSASGHTSKATWGKRQF